MTQLPLTFLCGFNLNKVLKILPQLEAKVQIFLSVCPGLIPGFVKKIREVVLSFPLLGLIKNIYIPHPVRVKLWLFLTFLLQRPLPDTFRGQRPQHKISLVRNYECYTNCAIKLVASILINTISFASCLIGRFDIFFTNIFHFYLSKS